MRQRSEIEELIERETEKRLDVMQKPGYIFPKRASRADYIAIVISIAVCLLLIVLCMTEVIR